MAREIKQKINIEFISKGLEEIQEVLTSFEGKIKGKGATDSFKKLNQDLQVLYEIMKDGEKEIGEETFKSYEKEIKRLLSLFDQVRKGVVLSGNAGIEKEIKGLEDQIAKLQENIDRIQKDLSPSKRKVWKEDGGSISTSQKFEQEIFKNVKETEGLKTMTQTNRPTENYQTFETLIKRIKEELAKVNMEYERFQEISKEGFDKRTLKKADIEALKEFNKEGKIKLSLDQMQEQVINNLILQREREAIINKELEKQEKEISQIRELKNQQSEIEIELEKTFQKLKDAGIDEKEIESYKEALKAKMNMNKVLEDGNRILEEQDQKQNKVNKSLDDHSDGLGKAAKNVLNYAIVYSTLRRLYRETIKTVTELDKALTSMVVVTDMTRQEAWKLVPALQDLAYETGFTTTEVANLTKEFLRQGRSLSDALELTEVAAKAARIAGISAADSINYLTAAVNGFGLEANDAAEVADKFAALAAQSATSYEELAKGLSKFASQAKIAGLSIDFSLGLLTKGIHTTREAPESIGTALKTVLARMRELTDLGKTFEDGMSVNRVETALRQVGVALRDSTGQFRDMESVITEIGMKWDTLNKNQQASVAVAMAGTRQQSRLLAMFQDFDKTLEFVNESQKASGAMMQQHADYMESMEAAMAGLQTAWQQFITAITDSELIVGVIKGITGVLKGLNAVLSAGGKVTKNIVALMIVLFGLYKATNVVIGISTALKTAENKADLTGAALQLRKLKQWTKEVLVRKYKNILVAQSTIAIGAETKADIISTATKAAKTKAIITLTAVTMIYIAAAALLVMGIAFLIKKMKEENKSIEERIQKHKDLRQEITNTRDSIRDLIDEYDRFNRKIIKTDEDIKALEELKNKIKDLELEDFKITYYADGTTVDYVTTMSDLRKKELEKEKERIESIKKEYDELELYLSGRVFSSHSSVGDYVKEMSQGYHAAIDENNLSDYENDLKRIADTYRNNFKTVAAQMTIEYGLSASEEEVIRSILSTMSDLDWADFLMSRENISPEYMTDKKWSKFNWEEISREVANINDIIEESRQISPRDMIETYTQILKNTTNPEIKKIIQNSNPFIEWITDFERRTGAFNFNLIEGFSQNTLTNLNEMFFEKGLSFTDMMTEANIRLKKLREANPEAKEEFLIAQAWGEIAENIDDAATRELIYQLSTKKTNLEIAQGLDHANSMIDNINKKQKEFLEGGLSSEDLYGFLEEYPELLTDDNLFQRFLDGQNVSLQMVNQKYEEQLNAKIAIQDLEREIALTTNASQKKDLLMRKRQLEMLLSYKGELQGLTEIQYQLNKAREMSEKLNKLGIEDSDLQQRIIQQMATANLTIAKEADNQIASTLNIMKDKFGDSYLDLFEEVNGVVVMNTAKIIEDQLSPDLIGNLGDYLAEIQREMDKKYDANLELIDTQVKAEEEAAKKKKKIYEDYFKSLDRLEQKRDHAQSREDIIKQLQRLEGATDQASKQRAKQLKTDLIKMDQKQAEDERKQSREDFLDSFDKAAQKLKDELLEAYKAGGDIWEQKLIEIAGEMGKIIGDKIIDQIDQNPKIKESGYIPYLKGGSTGGPRLTYSAYSSGGLIDYTGPAMVHGSRSNPEMVLSARQTEMFFGLRDALQSIVLDGNSSAAAVNIDNITIKTDSLNSNLDFNRAGQQLAEAFGAAINRRGINLNTKR